MKNLSVLNRQRLHKIATSEFRKAGYIVMEELLSHQSYNLSVTFLNAKRMAEINQKHLKHQGSTDVITFDYSSGATLEGELLICPSIASKHSQQHNVSMGNELIRYYIHGVLHLLGYDDKNPNDRRKMKRKERLLLKQLSDILPLDKLAHG